MKRALFIALAAVAVPAAAAPNPLVEAAPFIDRANAEWGKAIIAGDVDTIVAPYADDGVFILPDGNAVEGKAAIRQMYAARPKRAQIVEAAATSDGPTDARAPIADRGQSVAGRGTYRRGKGRGRA